MALLQLLPIYGSWKSLLEILELVDTLQQIYDANQLMEQSRSVTSKMVQTLKQYEKLHCQLTPVEEDSPVWRIIQQYITKGYSKQHQRMGQITLTGVFEVEREGEAGQPGGEREERVRREQRAA